MPTPNSPEIAGCSGCRRTMRQPAIATPLTRAAITAGRSSRSRFATTKTTTGIVEATIPEMPPICCSIVGRTEPGSAAACGGSGVTWPDRSRSTGCRAPSGPPAARSARVPAWSGPARCPGSGDVPARSASLPRCRRTARPRGSPRRPAGRTPRCAAYRGP